VERNTKTGTQSHFSLRLIFSLPVFRQPYSIENIHGAIRSQDIETRICASSDGILQFAIWDEFMAQEVTPHWGTA
jgi:hypothetical protein